MSQHKTPYRTYTPITGIYGVTTYDGAAAVTLGHPADLVTFCETAE